MGEYPYSLYGTPSASAVQPSGYGLLKGADTKLVADTLTVAGNGVAKLN